ncbi:hypothetical protein BN7_343 [Wickerhamomyces ciferrii]|uniref:Uncharacterized protein n=1 Tax=Wickerhamomyces ciferrii (strain ATCC 14091 / BCRC 22168 / CBS 111 / JCM 3599 / NBRC 0793 / NRRL Y-1031 F-60-10) TaxID=1206466 RepID=K0KHI2_WICCF|nr:uncharacterized protein BN7_343 [Wickerhamomyces ciferrii]CCH40809.1 hypothetical protein BN7_343 [Wickerhamomyces ciferrii]
MVCSMKIIDPPQIEEMLNIEYCAKNQNYTSFGQNSHNKSRYQESSIIHSYLNEQTPLDYEIKFSHDE